MYISENQLSELTMEKPKKKAPPREYGFMEKLLLPIALLIGILYDRLIVRLIHIPFAYEWHQSPPLRSAIFWLCYLAIFYMFFWKRLKHDYAAHFVAICTIALCVWNFIFREGNSEFYTITFLVIPAVLMAHAMWNGAGHTLKNSEGIIMSWLSGFLIKPFSALPHLFGSLGSLLSDNNKPTAKRVFIGVVIAFAMMVFILPLLMGADQVFNYYIQQMFAGLSFFTFIFHSTAIIIITALFYSFLWNIGFGENKTLSVPESWSVDIIISSIALGSVIFLYILFCIVQFTYLFAGAGLPAGMTYSEYAREGFAQTVAVCAINLLIFAVFLRLGKGQKLLTALLGGLLALTGIMLVSGAVRLNLYIDAYGMTWLRLLSAWFIIYLVAVITLCSIRLFIKKELPVAALCGLLLLIWYVALGYLNPDGFVEWYNLHMIGNV
ncbi:MAG: DUF4173 domain-containing protein [Defluviitaleaceae bacterium]|nr:DUF4173 domain-containing protein [Defluviitaleaceae bacterium]